MTIEQYHLIRLMNESFYRLSGRNLYCPPGVSNLYQWLNEEAPYSILAHNREPAPHFIYANDCALSCFKYTLAEILTLPSMLSATAQDRPERERLLQIVQHNGIAYHYSGPRVDRYGTSFMIYDGVIWQFQDSDGEPIGQAALFWTEENGRPEWYDED